MNEINYDEFKNITIESIEKEYFSHQASLYLKEMEINTLADLFSFDILSLSSIPTKSKQLRNQDTVADEIIGTVKLLKYKYLGEELDICFDEPDKIDLKTSFGFSAILNTNVSRKYWRNMSEFIEIVKNGEFDKFSNIRGIGITLYNQMVAKCSIVSDYYKNSQIKQNKSNSRKIEILQEIRKLSLELENILLSEGKIAVEDMLLRESLTKIFSDDKEKTIKMQ